MSITIDRRGFLLLGGTAALAVGVPALLSGCTPAPAGSATASGSATAEFPFGSTQVQALGAGLCTAPSYIAKEKGFWAEAGIDVELVSGTFQQQKDGLASGQFLATNGDFQFFPAVEQGLDIKIIGGLHIGCIKLLVPANSPIQTVADLKGKKIGVDEIGGTPWAITALSLGDAGIDPAESAGQVTFAPYDLTTLEEVANRGEVDAIAAWDPFGTQAERNGFRVLVDISTHPLFAGRFCCFLYGSGPGIESQPGAVKALLDGWLKAVEWISANPEETAAIVTDGSQHEAYVASEDTELIVELLKSYHFKQHASDHSDNQAREDTLYFVEKLQKIGFLSAGIDATEFTDNLVVTL